MTAANAPTTRDRASEGDNPTPKPIPAHFGVSGHSTRPPDPSDAWLLVKTLARPAELDALLRSVRLYYPLARILVADDAADHGPARSVADAWGAGFLPLGHDVGLSAGRNALVDACEAPYFILLDDDFVFLPTTNLGALLGWLRHDMFDFAGGLVRQNGKAVHYEGHMTLADGTLTYRKLAGVSGPTRVDICWNFLAGTTAVARSIRWDDRLKVCEHQAFFLRAQAARASVVYVPDVEIDHRRGNNKTYSAYRGGPRSNQYWKLFCDLYGVANVVGSLA